MPNAKSKRSAAERAAVHYAFSIGCVITRKAIRTKFQSVDFFCSDIVGKKADGSHVYIQVTAGEYEAVRQRKRKLESIPWHDSDTVLLLQLIQEPDPVNAKRKLWFFRVHRYYHHALTVSATTTAKISPFWQTDEKAVEIPKEWFKARKET